MDLRRLEYFLAVAEAGTVTRAGERCFVTQSALSTQIARLEEEVGTPLFLRGPRGVRLTRAGETLRPLATRVLAEVAALEGAMAALQGLVRGRLHLGLIQGLPVEIDVVELVTSFHARHPEVVLEVRTGASEDLAAEVVDGVLDLALVALSGDALPNGLVRQPVRDDPLVAVVPAGSVRRGRRRIGLAELLALGPFVHYRRRSGLRRSVEEALGRADLSVEAPFELDQISDMVRFAGRGLGVTVVPASATRAVGSEVVALDLTDRAAKHTVGVVSTEAPSPAARAFLEIVLGERGITETDRV